MDDNNQAGLSGEIQIKKPDGTVVNLKLQSKPKKEQVNGDSKPRSGNS